ncbi:MAG TPA: exodeoxyribonuclease V subunit beta [Sedimenticola sp.]|nr:exodeoxyribonuclease V subunit beta [Sedimenticola sp.]
MDDLKPFEMPLEGISLIEASAGTGKTWNITSLYLRMLLELELKVEQILVVTFTRAATEELRERIRGRVARALSCLASDDESCLGEDAELAHWLSGRDCRESDAAALRLALASMDSAAVFTIHSFCQRVLTDHAFDTDMAFDLSFLEDEEQLRLQAVEDFWRQWYAKDSIPPLVNRALLERWSDPRVLLESVKPRLADELRLLPEIEPTEQLIPELEKVLERLERAHAEVKKAWQEEERALTDFLTGFDGLNRRSYQAHMVAEMLASARQLCSSEIPLLSPGQKLVRISTSGLRLKNGYEAPPLAFFDAGERYLAALDDLHSALKPMGAAFQMEARRFIREHLAQAKAREGQLYFDDLLTALDRALQGQGGEALAGQLRRQYPQALIDEFQDTDEVQYRIFHAIWGGPEAGAGLCLIGDPKQAIYGFRGGDIYTYLEAARDAGRRYSLGTNWRSCSGLVEAVNTLFQTGDRPFMQEEIGYHKVDPAPDADDEPLLVDRRRPVPLQFWKLLLTDDNQHQGKIKAPLARQMAARACAAHITFLLQPGTATLGGRELQAGDIALLARTHSQVEELQEALRVQGIHSVSLTDESVFATEEAGSLRALLQAVIYCEDEALLRYALADRLLGSTAGEIDALIRDDDRWEAVQQRFFGYRERWREAGFIQAFTALLHNEGIPGRLLALVDGERRLTNLMQLVELLQQASRARPGLEELVRWLTSEMEASGRYEEAKLRLESDEGLVKIVTMHASKGLEYPLVYIPFPWNDQGRRDDPLPWFYHDGEGRPALYFGGDPELDELAKVARWREAQAEKLRLFYVSVTRAAQLCVLPWGRVNGAEQSALAWLLHPGEGDRSTMGGLDEEAIFARLEALAEKAQGTIEVRDLPEPTGAAGAAGAEVPELRARDFGGRIQRDWKVNSYSGLIRGGSSEAPDYDAVSDALEAATPSDHPIQRLPAGPAFGLLVHVLLENLDFPSTDDHAIRQQVIRLSWRHGLPELRGEAAQEAMVSMIRRLMDTRLEPAGLCLGELARSHRLDEMEFHFSVERFSRTGLDQVLRRHAPWRQVARGLDFSRFRGLMHGYIDLVFEHGGRYWLADYKTNRLDGYVSGVLEEAMAAHHYPLQGLIYALALHRHLAQRLKGYDPARHFGGIFYLFTRGMRPGSEEGIWFRPVPAELLRDLDDYFRGRDAA